ncbi:HDIG domain-containing protein, partial [Candidatus Woesebacteria bacterium]|nr:HDIG domain-containing protein [Candidatus Woesebacteria bacterium]
MKIVFPTAVLQVISLLQEAGFEAYVVGGAVRDVVLSEAQGVVKDFDITTDATPEEIQAVFPESFYENTFGTVSVTLEHLAEQLGVPVPEMSKQEQHEDVFLTRSQIGKVHVSLKQAGEPAQIISKEPLLKPIEITTFRSDGAYSDGRRPDSVVWGHTLGEDLERRDFTINAMALAVPQAKQWLKQTAELLTLITLEKDAVVLYDPFDGLDDLATHTIRCVGEPNLRFGEDALRMLRAIRFSVQLNMQIERATYDAIAANHQLTAKMSWERIRDEFLKMLSSPFPKEAIELLDETGLLQYIMPELLAGKGCSQGGHHTTDVWTHSLDALAECPSPDPIVRLATLLHDIGKPQTRRQVGNTITFYNHEIVGARMAKTIARRLALSKRDAERVYVLVRHHMFYYQTENTDASIRRFMRTVGLANINDILALREGDRLGSGARKTSWRLEEMKERMLEQLNQPFAVTDLK